MSSARQSVHTKCRLNRYQKIRNLLSKLDSGGDRDPPSLEVQVHSVLDHASAEGSGLLLHVRVLTRRVTRA